MQVKPRAGSKGLCCGLSGDTDHPAGDIALGLPAGISADRVIGLLRFSRLRIAASRISLDGVRQSTTERAVRAALGGHGVVDLLPDGGVLFLHVGFPAQPEAVDLHDLAAGTLIRNRLADRLPALLRREPVICARIASVHLWSDEILDIQDLSVLLRSDAVRRARVDLDRSGWPGDRRPGAFRRAEALPMIAYRPLVAAGARS